MKDKHKGHPHPPWEEMRQNPCMLCGEVSRLLHQLMREQTELIGINPTYRPFIHFLSEHDGVTQLDLANVTHLAAPTVSVTLQKMEQEGLIMRQTDTKDQRQLLVYITEAGRTIHAKAREQIRKAEEQTLRGISEQDCQKLLSILSQMRKNLIEERGEKADHETD